MMYVFFICLGIGLFVVGFVIPPDDTYEVVEDTSSDIGVTTMPRFPIFNILRHILMILGLLIVMVTLSVKVHAAGYHPLPQASTTETAQA